MNKEQLLKYSKGECSVTEAKVVEELLAISSESRKIVNEYEILLAISDDIQLLESIDYHTPLSDIKKVVNQGKRQLIIGLFTKVAAIMMLPLLASSLILAYLLISTEADESQYTEIIANSGTIIKHSLPDKSIVWLNSGTKLRYAQNYSKKNRTIELIDGEAFFEIEADKDNPFYVNTPSGMSIYVYGTRFNVRNLASDSIIETVLEEGALNVLVSKDKLEYELTPGENLIYNKYTNEVMQNEVDLWAKTAWHEGKLIFRNTSLEDVLNQLSTHFNVDIEYVNHKGINYRYRATFSNESLQQILTHLSKSASITWEEIKGGDDQDKIRVDIY